jgi:hypothetical protein
VKVTHGEERIPFSDVAVARPLQRDRLWPVEHCQQWHAANRREMVDEGPHQRFGTLVRHEGHLHPPRILQPTREAVHPLFGPLRKPTSTCPKSCCENSPAKPSKRTSGRTAFGRRLRISSYSAVFPPAYPFSLARRRISTDSRFGSPAKISATRHRNRSALAGRPTHEPRARGQCRCV